MSKGWFVTGTDTRIGKTLVSCMITQALVRRGYNVGVMKPVSAGGREDAKDLIMASGVADDLDLVNPVALPEPLSPNLAAERSSTSIDTERILEDYKELTHNHEFMIVEGAGGLLVPLSDECLIADLVQQIGLSLIIVSRTSLGTINHTLLTIEAARSRQIDIAGVIYNQVTSTGDGLAESCSPEIISRISGVSMLGTVPNITNQSDLGEIAEKHLDLSMILRAG